MLKGLEALEDIRDICSDMTSIFDNDLLIIEKDLKALEIIKEKEVDIKAFNDLQDYNYYCSPELTQEEYDLLKEVLYEKEN